ncbi:hypothetical protein AZE42_13930 [Rhizopogon vesiculosus]|uniref:Uncharacterized protein n=1 Tax=Rhizopogon vesiculosus TaxID=180088 RepID=A0A1J8R241_9AGAM|nr:hypothetical protein AZE42_13930 [Rhizopogon vesiculosus]
MPGIPFSNPSFSPPLHDLFMDAYQKGLTGKQAVWASKKYRGRRALPSSIFAELEKAGL